MRGIRAAVWTGLLTAGALAGCGRNVEQALTPAPAPAPATVATAADAPHTVVAGALRVTAVGTRDGDVLHVSRLEVRDAPGAAPRQVIDGLATDTPWTADAPGMEAPDMDFDGHPDLRLIEFRAAGPNTPWRHWLYDPASGGFVASEALDALSPTRFDAQRHVVVVDWRDGAARHGSDAYRWRDGQLEPVP